jgi:hypothetical protein
MCSLFGAVFTMDISFDPDLIFYGISRFFSASSDLGGVRYSICEADPGDVFSDRCLGLSGVFGGVVWDCQDMSGRVSSACDETTGQLRRAVGELGDLNVQSAHDIRSATQLVW